MRLKLTKTISNFLKRKIRKYFLRDILALTENEFSALNNKIDLLLHQYPIESLQPANGKLRLVQLIITELLKHFHHVCSENNITYWLDCGTLLGAVRHQGFIPWDDDIDVAILKPEAKKLFDCFSLYSKNSPIEIEFFNNTSVLRIYAKRPYLFMDVEIFQDFPESHINNKNKYFNAVLEDKKNSEQFDQFFTKPNLDSEKLSWETLDKSKKILMRDPDHFLPTNYFFEEDTILPTKTIAFENYSFNCPNKPDTYLRHTYGEYMSLPKGVGNIKCNNRFKNESYLSLQNILESITFQELSVPEL